MHEGDSLRLCSIPGIQERLTLTSTSTIGNVAPAGGQIGYSCHHIQGILPASVVRKEESFVESSGYSLELLLIAGIAMGLVGLLLGWLVGRRSSPGARKHRALTLKLDQVIQDKKAYEDEVVEHFTETARLLNNLTESYREVHNHLAEGAADLCHGKGPVSLEHIQNRNEPAEIPANLVPIQPPLDYAPKIYPDEKGMLNEEFGLERKATEKSDSKAG